MNWSRTNRPLPSKRKPSGTGRGVEAATRFPGVHASLIVPRFGGGRVRRWCEPRYTTQRSCKAESIQTRTALTRQGGLVVRPGYHIGPAVSALKPIERYPGRPRRLGVFSPTRWGAVRWRGRTARRGRLRGRRERRLAPGPRRRPRPGTRSRQRRRRPAPRRSGRGGSRRGRDERRVEPARPSLTESGGRRDVRGPRR